MYINLSGLNVLVTGASKGIGKAIASKLAEAGATVAVHYNKNMREAENLAHVLGNESKSFQADLSQPDGAAQLFDRVILEMGSLEILINNAGIAEPANIDAKESEWLAAWNNNIQVNLTSAGVLCKKVIEHFLKRKSAGRIINITSRAASKAGLVAITKSIARAYGKDGIKAFNIAPGFVRTDMSRKIMEEYGNDVGMEDISLERMTEPKDIAPLVTFLASGMADHATGSTIDVNAGSYMR